MAVYTVAICNSLEGIIINLSDYIILWLPNHSINYLITNND